MSFGQHQDTLCFDASKRHVGSGNEIASLARANASVHVHNLTDFPHAKLDSKIKARFLLTSTETYIFFYCLIIVYILPSLI